MDKVVSVIIPTYNHARSLPRTLDALLKQRDFILEIILIDDGSTDNTLDVIEPYRDSIRYIFQENRGANFARNKGLDLARGEFVIILDADIELYDNALEKMIIALRDNPEASFAYGGFYFGWKYFRPIDFSVKQLKIRNCIHTSSLVRRQDHPGFDENIFRFQDWDVWLAMSLKGKRGVMINDVLFRAHIDGSSRIGSSWLPSFLHKIPWPILGFTPKRIKEYNDAREIIFEKYNL